jgi:endonuclease/exonuclease/phosphatase family metal-dependent hydrolase
MRPLIAALLPLLACEPALEAPPATGTRVRTATLVRVATWNVHDLFDAEDRVVPPGDADLVPSGAEVEAKLARVAAVLERLDADLVLLAEVETRQVLERLASLARYPAARLVDGNDPRGIDVAVLSRFPIEGYTSHAGELGPDGRLLWPRDCVEVAVQAAGRRTVLVGTHLSSGVSDDGTRRRRQAARLREIADGVLLADPHALVLAGGDLNDVPESPALEPLLGDGSWVDPLPPWITTWGGGHDARRLDYLLLPAGAASAVLAAWAGEGADVAAASDHRPVVLDLLVER